VHRCVVLALAGASIALLIPTYAHSFTYGELVAGQVQPQLVHGSASSWCLVDNGSTELQINQSNTKAVISFAELIYFDGSTYYSLDGQTILTFNSGNATDGVMHFKRTSTYPNQVRNPNFMGFTQTYDPSTDQLIVAFSVNFPNCTLPIYAVYDAP
jgi:hypothetical protein